MTDRPGMYRHWSDLLMPLCIGLACWAVGIAVVWVIL